MNARTREAIRLVAFILLAAVGIAKVRPGLFLSHARVRDRQDTYFLPPPGQLVTLSLGYRSALADVLWAHLLVAQGLHTLERRRFDNLLRLYDAINELDPSWRAPYLYADALITFQVGETPFADVVAAREILERSVRQHPYDAELWLNLGQFVSFVAPGTYLADDHPELAQQWRIEGARMLARAAELGAGDRAFVGWQAIGAAGIFERAGEREAAIRFLERTRSVTDDEELRRFIDAKLAALLGERELQKRLFVDSVFKKRVIADLPFAKRAMALVLGPPLDPDRCAGSANEGLPECAPSWRQWTERLEQTQQPTP